MSITLKSTEVNYDTLALAIENLPSGGDTIIIRDKTISECKNGVDKKIIWDVEDVTFSNNTPGANYGGAVDITASVSGSSFNRTTFKNNTANSGSGAIFVRKNADVTMTVVTFENNSAANGGAIYNSQDSATIKIDGAVFRENEATDGNGGAIRNDKVMYIGNAEFYDNSCTKNGSAIYNGGTIYITGKMTLGEGQTIYNNGTIQILGGSFLTAGNQLAKAVDATDSSWLSYNKKLSVSSGYKIFTADDNDLYVTNAGSEVNSASMVGDYAAVVGDTAYYGTHYDSITAAAAGQTVVSGYTSSSAETLAEGATLLITNSEVGNITFAGNNSVVIGNETVKFTGQDLSDVTLAVNGTFDSGDILATGITQLPETITVNGAAVSVNGTGIVSADGKSIISVTLADGNMKLQTVDTLTVVQTAEPDNIYTFATPEDIEKTYGNFTGNIQYDITAYNSTWKTEDTTPQTITVFGKEYKLYYGKSAYNSITNIRNATSANGTLFYYQDANAPGIYAVNIADVPVVLYEGTKKNGDKYAISAGTDAKSVDITLYNVNASEVKDLYIGQNTDVVNGNWSTTLLNMTTQYIDANHRGYIYASDGTVNGNISVTVKECDVTGVNLKKDGECSGDISALIQDSRIAYDVMLYTGSSENIAKNVSIEVENSYIEDRIISSGLKQSVIDGNVTVSLTDSWVKGFIALSYGHALQGVCTVNGNAAVTLSGATTGGVYRSRNNGIVNGEVSLTATAGSSEAGTVSGVDVITVKDGAKLSIAALEVFGTSGTVSCENGATLSIASLDFATGTAISFTAVFDISQTTVTIDGTDRQAGDIIATGVTGTLGIDDIVANNSDLYLAIENSGLVLKAYEKIDSVTASNGSYFGKLSNDGSGISVTISDAAEYNGTVRAGSASGTDSFIKSTVTAGTFNNNLYGGGLVSAVKTDITVSGTTEVKQILYGGIFVKEKESATDLGESNLTVAGGVFNHNVVGGSRVDVNENALNVTHTTAKVNLTISGGTFAKTGTKTDPGVAVYSAGYVNGIGEGKNASTGYDYKVNENTVVINGGENGDLYVKGAVYGGVFACQGGKADVGKVSISVENAKVDRVLGGGWAQTGGKSDVGSVAITLGKGADVGIVYAGGGNAKVGTTEVFGKVDETIQNVTITVDGGDVGEIFMGGRYNKSVVTGAVVVTINSEADSTISRISGKNGYGVRLENAGSTELVVNSTLNVGMLDSVDKLTIAEGKTLTLGSAEFTGMDVCLELGTDGFDGESWDVLSGISLENLTQAEFFIGGSQLTFDDNGVYTGNDFKLELKDNKLTMLAKA